MFQEEIIIQSCKVIFKSMKNFQECQYSYDVIANFKQKSSNNNAIVKNLSKFTQHF